MHVSNQIISREQPIAKYKFNKKHGRLEYLDLAKPKAFDHEGIFSEYTNKYFGTSYLANVVGLGSLGGLAAILYNPIIDMAGSLLSFSAVPAVTPEHVSQVFKRIQKFGFFEKCILKPTLEEIAYRGLIQGGLLFLAEKGGRKILGSKFDVDAKTIAIAKVLLTTSFFAYEHLSNRNYDPLPYVITQVAHSFLAGATYGLIKETRAGLLGSITAHVINNSLAYLLTSYMVGQD